MTLSATIQAALENHRSGYSLPACLYNDKAVFQNDIDRFLMPGWLYACHQSELQTVGQYILFEVAGESIIVVRSAEDSIQAHMNVCRHRGSRVCLDSQGSVKKFTCPYHSWVYGLNGDLKVSREMPADFDQANFGLRSVKLSIVHGLVFINFDSEAPSLNEIVKPIDSELAFYQVENTKVAYQETWNVEANWKLAMENFMECYHCAPAHPEYARAHSLKLPERLSAELYEPLYKRCKELGIPHDHYWSKQSIDPLLWIFHHRQPLLDGYLTGSEDGRPVAPLLGDMPGYDGGAADIAIGLFCYGLIYADHIVLYSFLPASEQSTDMKVIWLVRQDAKEGQDYDVDRLTWLWRVTTDADKKIILNNQLGVNSRFYTPGPYSEMEGFTQEFVDWYVGKLLNSG